MSVLVDSVKARFRNDLLFVESAMFNFTQLFKRIFNGIAEMFPI